MINDDLSRRQFLQATGQSLAIAWVGLNWSDVVRAADAAHAAARTGQGGDLVFFTALEAADVEAIAAQIIPTDDTPGAREAGVVYFVDRALTSFFERLADPFRAQLHEFQSTCRISHPDTAFAGLPSDRQIDFLKSVEHTPFFATMHLLTLLGTFSMPAYGGNRHGLGWELLGFEDRHAFQPPFGYYDRDYPGFEVASDQPA